MSRRYDSRTTTFSPDGRLFQVEYAMEAISHAGACVGVLARDGVVLASERKILSTLLDTSTGHARASEKMYEIDSHVGCAVAGITADANTLINRARLIAQRYLFTYNERVPVEYLVQQICDSKQGYTQFGGLRPFGVSFLYAGWDRHYGFQLYASDPSGNYGGWRAIAIGQNHAASNSIFRQEYPEEGGGGGGAAAAPLDLEQAIRLVVKVFAKTMDAAALAADKMEFCTVTRRERGDKRSAFGDGANAEDDVVYAAVDEARIGKVIEEVKREMAQPQSQQSQQQPPPRSGGSGDNETQHGTG